VLTGASITAFAVSLSVPAVITAAGVRNDVAPAVSAAAAVQGRGEAPRQAGRGSGPSALGWEWWNDAEVQKELALSADKIKRINDFYGRRNAELRPIVHDYVKQQAELDKMTRDRAVDEGTYSLQVLKVESSRARLNESRMVMLYRMFRELTPEQHNKLQDILDRRFNRGNRGRAPETK
jgi:Spy/CpxP family protein refolding chaperone